MAEFEQPGEVEDQPDAIFRALLSGIRTTLPGSQVLLGFLLTVPLQARFESLETLSRFSYLTALLASACSTLLLIAPSAQARVRYPVSGVRRRTHSHVKFASYLALAGTLTLLVAVTAAVLFALSLVASTVAAILIAGAVGSLAAMTWVAIPLWWSFTS